MIDIRCPLDGEVYHADAAHVGKRIRCKKCRSLLPILGDGSTRVQERSQAGRVHNSQPQDKTHSVQIGSHRTVGVAVAGTLAALGVLMLWVRPNTFESVRSARTAPIGEATRGPSVSPDASVVLGEEALKTSSSGVLCDEQGLTENHSMPNGSRIAPDAGTPGYGVLEVQNGTKEDAVLSIYDAAADEMIREVYIQASHSVSMKAIPKGTYVLAFTKGLDWDGGGATFRCGDAEYDEFEQQIAFTEERDKGGVLYKMITLTLHPVPGGTVRTKRITRQEFRRRNHRTVALSR